MTVKLYTFRLCAAMDGALLNITVDFTKRYPVGALIFYTVIYFIGHYSAHGFNSLAKRELLNRRWTGLTGVVLIAAIHGYKIISSTPPSGHDESAMDALGFYVILPVGIITAVLLYLNWRDKEDDRQDENGLS